MTNLRLNTTDIIGAIIPSVYIDKVTLETRGDVVKERDRLRPHVDLEGEEGRRDPVTGRITTLRSRPEPEGFLTATVNLLLKDKIENGVVSSWLEQQEFSRYLKIAVAVSTSVPISNVLANVNFARFFQDGREPISALSALMTGADVAQFFDPPMESVDLARAFVRKNFFYNTFSVADIMFKSERGLGINNNSYEIQEDSDGNQIRNIGLRARFSQIQSENPRHLTVFALTYLDVRTLQDDFGDLDFGNIPELTFATGRRAIHAVIENSEIVRRAVYYTDEDGKVWTGPVHQMGNGAWMGGEFHVEGESQPILERVVVPNATVQDFRNVRDIDKHVVDFSFFESVMRPGFDRIFKERVKDNISVADKSSYFSDLYLSRGLDDQANMTFSFNLGKFVKENSLYPALLEYRPRLLQTHSRILNLKILRQRVNKPANFKKDVFGYEVDEKTVVAFDKNEPYINIIESTPQNSGIMTTVQNSQTLSSMREIKLGNDQTIRHFSISDRTMSNNTDGYYRYGVEIEIEDRTNTYLNDLRRDLVRVRKELLAYFMEAAEPTGRFKTLSGTDRNPHIIVDEAGPGVSTANSKGNYNPITNRFTQEFIERQATKYEENPEEKPWIQAVGVLTRILFSLTSRDSDRGGLRGTLWGQNLWVMCAPATGSPDGISAVLKLIDNVAAQLEKLLGVRTSPQAKESTGARNNVTVNNLSDILSSAGAVAPRKDTRKVSYWFSNAVFDANSLKRTGFHYLLDRDENIDVITNERAIAGMRTITTDKFQRRIDNETLRYFVEGVTEIPSNRAAVLGLDQLEALLVTPTASDYTYLAPTNIEIMNGESVSLFDTSLSSRRLAAAVSDIANMKSPPNQPKQIPSPRRMPGEWTDRSDYYSRVIRDNLVEVLADKNCTVELPLRASSNVRINPRNVNIGTGVDTEGSVPTILGAIENIHQMDGINGVANRATDYLGDRDNALGQLRENLERLIDIHTTRDGDVFNPGLLFLKILFSFALEDESLMRSVRTMTDQQIRDRFSVDNFSLSNTENAIERFRRNLTLFPRPYASFVPGLPNQIKSLFLASSEFGRTVIVDNDLFANQNVLSDPVESLPILLKYLNLVRIEVLTGFEQLTERVPSPMIGQTASNIPSNQSNTITKTETQLKKPMWQLLTREVYQNLVDQRVEMLCRLVPFKNSTMMVGSLDGVQLPTYDGYFIIQPPRSRFEQEAEETNTDWGAFENQYGVSNSTEYFTPDYNTFRVGATPVGEATDGATSDIDTSILNVGNITGY